MKIAILSPLIPHPQQSGSHIRIYHIVKNLALSHDVTLVSLDADDNSNDNNKFLLKLKLKNIVKFLPKSQNLIRRIPNILAARPFTADPNIVSQLNTFFSDNSFDVIIAMKTICGFYLKKVLTFDNPIKVLDEGGVHHLFYYRKCIDSTNMLENFRSFLQWKKVKAFEKKIVSYFDIATSVSENEMQIIKIFSSKCKTILVPNGVDLSYFTISDDSKTKKRKGVMFCGSYSYSPNVKAVKKFLNEVLPHLDKSIPFYIIGANPPEEFINIAANNSQVKVTGFVEDIRPWFEKTLAQVNPMTGGGGTRLKVITAMAMGCPVISTRIGAEGIEAKDGEHILIAKTPQEFVTHINSLQNNPAKKKKLVKNARKFIEQKYDWEVICNYFLNVIENYNKE